MHCQLVDTATDESQARSTTDLANNKCAHGTASSYLVPDSFIRSLTHVQPASEPQQQKPGDLQCYQYQSSKRQDKMYCVFNATTMYDANTGNPLGWPLETDYGFFCDQRDKG